MLYSYEVVKSGVLQCVDCGNNSTRAFEGGGWSWLMEEVHPFISFLEDDRGEGFGDHCSRYCPWLIVVTRHS